MSHNQLCWNILLGKILTLVRYLNSQLAKIRERKQRILEPWGHSENVYSAGFYTSGLGLGSASEALRVMGRKRDAEAAVSALASALNFKKEASGLPSVALTLNLEW